jgi:hypothetical protein
MRFVATLLLAFASLASDGLAGAQQGAASQSAARAQIAVNAPLPSPTELLERALDNQKKLAAERERYECHVTDQVVQTDKNGNIKKNETEVDDEFFVNGIPIDRTLQKNGKDLSPGEVKKQDERVMKETLKYSNATTAQKETNKQDQEVEDILGAMMLTNGRRTFVNGRSVLDSEIVPNPRFQAKNIDQRFATVMQGAVSLDEQSGVIIDFNVRSVADLKIGGGLLADLHKGFWIHIHNHAEPDGVWITDLAEGSGDARAALFFHPYFRFRETTGDCNLYTATAAQAGPVKAVK